MHSTKVSFALVLISVVNGVFGDLLTGRSANFDADTFGYYQENLRARRSPQDQVSLSANQNDQMKSLRGDISGTLMQTDRAKLDGNAYYQRNWGEGVPKYQTGAGLKLNHNNGFTGSINYDKMPHSSSLGATAGYKLYESRDGRSSLTGEAHYNRNFGGYGPKQNYGGFLNYRRTF